MPNWTAQQLIDADDTALPSAVVLYGDETQLLEECKNAVFRRFPPGNINRLYTDELTAATMTAAQPGGGLFGGDDNAFLTYVSVYAAPTPAAQEVLQNLINRTAAPDKTLILISALPDLKKKAWFKRLCEHKNVAAVGATPQSAGAAAGWIRRFAGEQKVRLTKEAVAFLAEQTQGNLMAAKQAINKIALNTPDSETDADALRVVLSDGASYTVFDFSDAVLEGKATRAIRIMHHLRMTDYIEPLILWALADIVNKVAAIHSGDNPVAWGARLQNLKQLAHNLPPQRLPDIMSQLTFADRVIKGVGVGESETALTRVIINLSAARRSVKIRHPAYQPEL